MSTTKVLKKKKTVPRILIIGGGISGLSLAACCAQEGWKVEVREKNKEIGGLLADSYNTEAECYVSWSGPHIMNFSDATKEAMSFLKKYTKLVPFTHRVLCVGNGTFTMWPINKTYKEVLSHIHPNENIEEKMFSEFVASYSQKMWQENYKEVLPNIQDRWAPKETRDTRFFSTEHVYIPNKGYTQMMKKMSEGVKVVRGRGETISSLNNELENWDYVISTSHIDEFFDNKHGRLEYEGIEFTFFTVESDDPVLPTPVVNLNTHPTFTRISEMNQFYNSPSQRRVLCLEKPSRKHRFYPVKTQKNKQLLGIYREEAKKYKNVLMHGRLGDFQYKDIDDAVQDSLMLHKKLKSNLNYDR